MFKEYLLTEKNTVVNCNTHNKVVNLLKWMRKHDKKLMTATSWMFYNEGTCYNIPDEKFGSIDSYLKRGFKVVSYEDALI